MAATPRSTGNAIISFGMVSVPVKLYTAVSTTENVSFNYLAPSGGRVKQQYVDDAGAVVERDALQKGYEYIKDKFITFTADELEAISAVGDQTISIAEFVCASDVPPMYYGKPYHLGPDKGGDKAFRLLRDAMRTKGLSALGRYKARGKQYIVLLTPLEDGILLHQLNYEHEVRPMVNIDPGEVKPQELALACMMIDSMRAESFDPSKYRDEVRDRTLHLIEQKVQGADITALTPVESIAKIASIMDALKASMDRAAA